MHTDFVIRSLATPVLALALSAAAAAQCANTWQPGLGILGLDGQVLAITVWDQDGGGPLPARTVVGGRFGFAGRGPAAGVAMWDAASNQWSALGTGLTGTGAEVRCLAVAANGDLLAGGVFTHAGGTAAANIARWNGSAWAPFGSGLTLAPSPAVNAMVVLPNGDLVVAGSFSRAGGVVVENVARWNGTSWSAVGSGHGVSPVLAMVRRPSGQIVIGGVGGSTGFGAFGWDGSSWSGLGGGGDRVYAMAVMPNGDLITAGDDNPGNVWRWNGALWQTIGSGPFGDYPAVRALAVLPDGSLVATGRFSTLGGPGTRNIARWNGVTWLSLGTGIAQASPTNIAGFALATSPNGDLFVGGDIQDAGGQSVANVARWSGSAWSSMGDGIAGSVLEIVTGSQGEVFVGGRFSRSGAPFARHVARVGANGAWTALGSGMAGATAAADVFVSGLAVALSGDLVAGGLFSSAGGVGAANVARWNGTTWLPMGSGTDGAVHTAATLPDGSVVVGGSFTTAGGVPASGIARWNGSGWSALGAGVAGGFSGPAVFALTVAQDGALLVGGNFGLADGLTVSGVARWHNGTWSRFGSGVAAGGGYAAVNALSVRRNGDLVIGGTFSSVSGVAASNVARWNGTSWSALGSGANASVTALAELPSGDVVATGTFTSPAARIARWDGATWSGFGNGLAALLPVSYSSGGAPQYFPIGWALQVTPAGRLLVGGTFSHADGVLSMGLATLASGCPATSTVVGAGCSGSAGPLTLETTSQPWIGGSYGSRAVGFAAGAVGVSVFGTSAANVPLAQLHPNGGPGCVLWTVVDSADLVLSASGIVQRTVPIPRSATLIGVALRHQVLQMEVAGAQLTRFTASDALQIVLGAF